MDIIVATGYFIISVNQYYKGSYLASICMEGCPFVGLSLLSGCLISQ